MLEHEMSHLLKMKREVCMKQGDVQQRTEQHTQREERKMFHAILLFHLQNNLQERTTKTDNYITRQSSYLSCVCTPFRDDYFFVCPYALPSSVTIALSPALSQAFRSIALHALDYCSIIGTHPARL